MSGSWHARGHCHYEANCNIYRIDVVKQYDLSKEQSLERATTRKITNGATYHCVSKHAWIIDLSSCLAHMSVADNCEGILASAPPEPFASHDGST
jgi:hypothetical protein